MEDVLKAISHYRRKKDLKAFAKDMGFETNHPGKEAYAEEKFVRFRNDPVSFFFELDVEHREKLEKAIWENEYKCRSKFSHNFSMDIHEGVEAEIRIDFDYGVDHHYGADADGNRGVPMEFSEVENWVAYVDGKPICHKLPEFICEEIEAEVQRKYENGELAETAKEQREERGEEE